MEFTDYVIEACILVFFIILVVRYRLLDVWGAFVALFIGAIVLFSTNIQWFFLLLLFFILGFGVTKFRFIDKKKRGFSENGHGMRKAQSVAANGFIPALIALLSLFLYHEVMVLPFIAAISIAASDTFASEIGVLSNRAYLITTLKKVEAGTNGGVSWIGQGCALFGATVISVLAYLLIDIPLQWMVVCIVIGFFGCQIDSVLGATFQGKGKTGVSLPSNAVLNNSDVNLISISVGSLFAFVCAIATPL